jgi:hypothetical protein
MTTRRHIVTALDLAVHAMNAAADRVQRVEADDYAGAYAATGEALFWFGVVREELWHRHHETYQAVLEEQSGGFDSVLHNTRQRILGLLHVRDRITHEVDVITFFHDGVPIEGDPRGYRTSWRWRLLLAPEGLPKGAKGEFSSQAKFEAYNAVLVGQEVHDTFVRALSFLRMVHQRARTS